MHLGQIIPLGISNMAWPRALILQMSSGEREAAARMEYLHERAFSFVSDGRGVV